MTSDHQMPSRPTPAEANVPLREAFENDREAILDLRKQCFDEIDPEKCDPRFWSWEFQRSPAGAARMFVAAEGTRMSSHIALIPTAFVANGAAVRGAMAVDAMTSPAARGAGLLTRVVAAALHGTSGEFHLATAFQIRSAVLGAMLRNGWQIAERVPVLVRPASLRALAGLTPSRRSRRADTTVRLLTPGDARQMETVARSFAGDVRVERNAAWLAWRFFENPFWKYRATGVYDGGNLIAYLIARRTTLRGLDTFAIADAAWRDVAAARTLLREAVGEAKSTGCQLVAALVSRRHPAFPLFLRRGFLPGPHRFRLLVHRMGGPSDPATLRWTVMWADTDHL